MLDPWIALSSNIPSSSGEEYGSRSEYPFSFQNLHQANHFRIHLGLKRIKEFLCWSSAIFCIVKLYLKLHLLYPCLLKEFNCHLYYMRYISILQVLFLFPWKVISKIMPCGFDCIHQWYPHLFDSTVYVLSLHCFMIRTSENPARRRISISWSTSRGVS